MVGAWQREKQQNKLVGTKLKIVLLCLLLSTSLPGFVSFFTVLESKVEYRILKGHVTGEPYDYGSVMHYGFNFFSIDSKRPVIVKLMPGGKQIGQRDGFSDLDLRKINKFYNCTKYISECSLLA